MSTHILSDVERVCDSLAVVNKGKLITTSTVSDLHARFALSSFEIEFEEDPAEFVPVLESKPWIKKVEKLEINHTPGLRVLAGDVSLAKHLLPQLIAESGLGLMRYELTMPSLEDIFVKLVEGDAKP
jgi:ABC-2 type transport system ATP-binding protein